MIPERAATFSWIPDDDACRSVDQKALGCRTLPSELVVDDDADNRTLLEFLLSSVGYAVATASCDLAKRSRFAARRGHC
jgi:hypothetical protein